MFQRICRSRPAIDVKKAVIAGRTPRGPCSTDTTLPAAPNPPEALKQIPRPKLREILPPGLITGASDDPSGIATYWEAVAQHGY